MFDYCYAALNNTKGSFSNVVRNVFIHTYVCTSKSLATMVAFFVLMNMYVVLCDNRG